MHARSSRNPATANDAAIATLARALRRRQRARSPACNFYTGMVSLFVIIVVAIVVVIVVIITIVIVVSSSLPSFFQSLRCE